jgi:hypothetical protein
MRLMDVWLDTTVREGFEGGRPLADIADETGLTEKDVLRRAVDLKVVPRATLADAQNSGSRLH